MLLAHNRREGESVAHQQEGYKVLVVVNQEQAKEIEVDEIETTPLYWTRRDAKELYAVALTRVRPYPGSVDNGDKVSGV